MRSALQLLGGIAVAGAVAAGSTAFTASGITATTTAGASFLGGTVSQGVDGATVGSVVFHFTSAANTSIDSVTITFTDAAATGKTATVTAVGPATPPVFTCGAIAGAVTSAVTCTVPAYAMAGNTINTLTIAVA